MGTRELIKQYEDQIKRHEERIKDIRYHIDHILKPRLEEENDRKEN